IGHARDTKSRVLPIAGTAARSVSDTKVFHTIEALRDCASFPEDCGGTRHIGTAFPAVKSVLL
ncbi:MAG: hypothetical protein K2X59_08485, partial [Sphingomonas sp.]|nr:hypothetical protein [Sphingomonas sp.]